MTTEAAITAVDEVDLIVRPEPHAFSDAERARIAAGWDAATRAKPGLWNGPFFLFDRAGVEEDGGRRVFRAEGAPTDFATFLDWRGRMPPDRRFSHVFPVGAVVSADDRLMVGRMGRHTANAGRLYPPSGSFDPDDLVDGPDGRRRLDGVANMLREIGEEVGLDGGGWTAEPGWLVIGSGPRRHALVRLYRVGETAAALERRVAEHLGREAEPELDGVAFPAAGERLDPATTVPYVNVLLAHLAGAR